MATTSVHNPAQFEPSDYTVEDYLDNRRPAYEGGSVEGYAEDVKMWEEDMLRTFGASWRQKIGHCIHCGNGMVRWITAVLHHPTGEVVVFGSDCTDRLGFENHVAFKLAQVQARAEARKVRFVTYNKRNEFLSTHPDIAEALKTIDAHKGNEFAQDVFRKLDQYGSLSDAQVNAVLASLKRDDDYAAKRATEASEPKGDAPEGRVVVSGVVLSLKWQESDFGSTRKMLIKLANNSKVYLTAPEGIEKGQTVLVRATFSRSKDDKSFAFGKRPVMVKETV